MLEDLCEAAVSINFKSQDQQRSDYLSSPQKRLDKIFKVKCFKCYGANSFNCMQCKGMQRISSNHPFAQLLGEILHRKIQLHKSSICDDRDEHCQRVEPIKQEQQDNDQRKDQISYCQIQYKFVQSINHACQASANKQRQSINALSLSLSAIDLISSHNNTKLFIKPPPDALNINSSKQNKLCNSCFQKIQNCYSLCKTCDAQNIKYWICDYCSDNNAYVHYPNHYFQAVIDYQSYKNVDLEGLTYEEFKEETISQQFNHSDKLDDIEQSQDKEMEFQVIVPDMFKANSSIAIYLEQKEKQQRLQGVQQKMPVVSRVRFQIDNLFSSNGFSVNQQEHKQTSINYSNHEESKPICQSKRLSKKKLTRKLSNAPFKQNNNENDIKVRIKRASSIHYSYHKQVHQVHQFNHANQVNQITEVTHLKHSNDYIFEDYICDHCKASPIINIRYHCQSCQDYDLCESCFVDSRCHVEHEFKRVDGLQLRQKARYKIFQQKDINLIQRCGSHLKRTFYLSQKSQKKGKHKQNRFSMLDKERMTII